MSTLDSFGFVPKRKGGNLTVSSKAITTESSKAFIQPIEILTTKKKISKKSIEYYFQHEQEEEEEEIEIPIVIRKKIPLLNILHQIEQDSLIDEFKETFTTKRKRNRDDNHYVKRQKTLERDLSYALRYLRIHTHNLRYKMNREKSNMFISNMTQEFLH